MSLPPAPTVALPTPHSLAMIFEPIANGRFINGPNCIFDDATRTFFGVVVRDGLVGGIDLPRQTAQTPAYWVGESGAITEGEGAFDKLSLRPKTLAALSTISRLMLLQSTPAIEMVVREDLLRVAALGIDLAALSGSGAANQPTGILNTAGVGSIVMGTNGGNVTFDILNQLRELCLLANAPQESAGFAMNPHVFNYLLSQKATTNQYLWPTSGGVAATAAPTVWGVPYAVSNQLRGNLTKGSSNGICSEMIYGSWSELIIGEWGTMELLVNPYDSTGFTTGDVKVRVMQTIDIGVRHAASFAVVSDLLTPGGY